MSRAACGQAYFVFESLRHNLEGALDRDDLFVNMTCNTVYVQVACISSNLKLQLRASQGCEKPLRQLLEREDQQTSGWSMG